MKRLGRIICILAAALLCALPLAACGGVGGGNIKTGKNGTLKIHYYAGGADSGANELVSDLYERKTGVRVNWIPSYTYNEIQNLLYERTNPNDILMPQLGVWKAQDMKILEPLDDVYDAVPEGQDHTIKANMSTSLYDYLRDGEGHVYQMNAMDSVSTLVYNADVLTNFLGQEGTDWNVPRTTDEFWAICDRLKTIGSKVTDKTSADMVYALTTSSQLLYYWDYIGNVFWAQYDGYESYLNYFEGKYYDEATKSWKTGPEINDTYGRKVALNHTSKMLSKGRGYIHTDVKDMGFKQAQQVLIGQGFGRNKAKAAFMVTGDWFQTEMSGALANTPADLRMMKPPVVSEICEVLPDQSVSSDAELSALIAAVDAGSTALTGEGYEVTQNDYNRVKEARSMIYSATYNYPVCIPSYRSDDQKKLAKEFLKYYFFYVTQQVIAEKNGGIVAPYGYKPQIQMTNFMQSRYGIVNDGTIVICENPKARLCYLGGLNDMPGAGNTYVDALLVDGKSPQSLLDDSKKQLVASWSTMWESAGLA